MLVGNQSHGSVGDFADTTNRVYAQGFTTGTHAAGYTLRRIDLLTTPDRTDDQLATINAQLWSAATGGGPGSSLANLTVPASTGGAVMRLSAPANTSLAANTTYYVVVWTVGNFDLVITTQNSDDEDEGSQAGWSINDMSHYKAAGSANRAASLDR